MTSRSVGPEEHSVIIRVRLDSNYEYYNVTPDEARRIDTSMFNESYEYTDIQVGKNGIITGLNYNNERVVVCNEDEIEYDDALLEYYDDDYYHLIAPNK